MLREGESKSPAMRSMPSIEWFEPKTLTEAVACLVDRRGQASLIAGGTDLVEKMNDGEISPQCLIDLSQIEEMAITAVLPVWTANIPSLWHALRLRQNDVRNRGSE